MSSDTVSTLLDLIQSVSGVSKIDLLNSIAVGSVGKLQRNVYGIGGIANQLVFSEGIKPVLPNSRLLIEIRITFTGTAPKIFLRRFQQNTTTFYDEQVLITTTFTSGGSYQFFALMTRGEQYNIYPDQTCTLDIKAVEYRMGL